MDKKITELPVAPNIEDSNPFAIVQGGVTKQVGFSVIKNAILNEVPIPSGGGNLYTQYGSNTDGALTQKFVSGVLNSTKVQIGLNANANKGSDVTLESNIAIGYKATANYFRDIAIGESAYATGIGAVAIGYGARGEGGASVTIGELAESLNDTSITSETNYESVTIGYMAKNRGWGNVVIGSTNSTDPMGATGICCTVIGNRATVTGDYGTAVGRIATAGISASAYGVSASATGASSTALGRLTTSAQTADVAVGYKASVNGPNGLALGSCATATGDKAIAVGGGGATTTAATATGDYSLAFGHTAKATGVRTMAVGTGATATANGAIAFGALSSASKQGEINVGSSNSNYGYDNTNTRLISGVHAGVNDTDAVNVKQLNGVITSRRMEFTPNPNDLEIVDIIRFSDGTQISSITYSMDSAAITTSWATGLYYYTIPTILNLTTTALPFLYPPTITVISIGDSSNRFYLTGSCKTPGIVTLPANAIFVIGRNSATASNLAIQIQAIGRWKEDE